MAYIDCNLYSSTVTVLEFLAPRLKHGMIVAFDDYFCWSPTQVSGERFALHEFTRITPNGTSSGTRTSIAPGYRSWSSTPTNSVDPGDNRSTALRAGMRCRRFLRSRL